MLSWIELRISLWSGLARILSASAEHFEKRSMQLHKSDDRGDEALADEELSKSSAPDHWLKMVKEKSPSFLLNLEAKSQQRQTPHPQRKNRFALTKKTIPQKASGANQTATNDHDSRDILPTKVNTPDVQAPEPKASQNKRMQISSPVALTKSHQHDRIQNHHVPATPISARSKDRGPVKSDEHKLSDPQPGDLSVANEPLASDQSFLESRGNDSPTSGRNNISVNDRQSYGFNSSGPEKASPTGASITSTSVELQSEAKPAHQARDSSASKRKINHFFDDLNGNQEPENKYSSVPSDTDQNRRSPLNLQHNQPIEKQYVWPELTGTQQQPISNDLWPKLPEDVWNDLLAAEKPSQKQHSGHLNNQKSEAGSH